MCARYTVYMFVLTVDQRSSRTSADGVPDLLAQLTELPTVLPFVRTVGDEVQAVLDSATSVVHACVTIARAGQWSVGVGLGDVEQPLPASSVEARGDAFIAAREAVEDAKNVWASLCVRTSSTDAEHLANATDAQTVLRLLVDLVARATDTQWKATAVMRDQPDTTQAQIAHTLNVSQQAVSKSLRAGRAEGIIEAIECAERLLDRAHQPWGVHAR